MNNMYISIILPVYNEESCIKAVSNNIIDVASKLNCKYEVIFVNDGSKDNTADVLNELAKYNHNIKVIHFARNYGQTAAMGAGIDHASGDIIIAMDSDGQNDPKDISSLIGKINEGYDVVSGWRQHRQDRALSRKLPSKLANWLISKISGVKLKDYGCSLKAYRSTVIKHVRLYGEMHRFIPIYANWYGAKITEIPVNHYARTSGQSKYGINRTFKVILDLIVVKFLHKYLAKPIYIIGGFGLFSIAMSILSFITATYLKIVCAVSYVQTPLPLLSVFFCLVGFLSILLGVVCEVLMRTYYESQDKKPYFIKETINIQTAK